MNTRQLILVIQHERVGERMQARGVKKITTYFLSSKALNFHPVLHMVFRQSRRLFISPLNNKYMFLFHDAFLSPLFLNNHTNK